jgi:hypothetical protein
MAGRIFQGNLHLGGKLAEACGDLCTGVQAYCRIVQYPCSSECMLPSRLGGPINMPQQSKQQGLVSR